MPTTTTKNQDDNKDYNNKHNDTKNKNWTRKSVFDKKYIFINSMFF